MRFVRRDNMKNSRTKGSTWIKQQEGEIRREMNKDKANKWEWLWPQIKIFSLLKSYNVQVIKLWWKKAYTEGHLLTALNHNPLILAFNLDKAEPGTPGFKDDNISALDDDWIWLLEAGSLSMISPDSDSTMVMPWELIRELQSRQTPKPLTRFQPTWKSQAMRNKP